MEELHPAWFCLGSCVAQRVRMPVWIFCTRQVFHGLEVYHGPGFPLWIARDMLGPKLRWYIGHHAKTCEDGRAPAVAGVFLLNECTNLRGVMCLNSMGLRRHTYPNTEVTTDYC